MKNEVKGKAYIVRCNDVDHDKAVDGLGLLHVSDDRETAEKASDYAVIETDLPHAGGLFVLEHDNRACGSKVEGNTIYANVYDYLGGAELIVTADKCRTNSGESNIVETPTEIYALVEQILAPARAKADAERAAE
jgi:hypothetical protein